MNNNHIILKQILDKIENNEYKINDDKYHNKKHRCFQIKNDWNIDFDNENNKILIKEIYNKKI